MSAAPSAARILLKTIAGCVLLAAASAMVIAIAVSGFGRRACTVVPLPRTTALAAPVRSEAAAVAMDIGPVVAARASELARWLTELRSVESWNRGRIDELRGTFNALVGDVDVAALVPQLAGEPVAEEFATLALLRWAQTEPMAAAAWLKHQPSASEAQIAALIRGIGDDAHQRAAIAELLADAPWCDALLAQAARASMLRNPTAAADFAQRIDSPELRERTQIALADVWARIDPHAAQTWIHREVDPNARDRLIAAATAAQVSQDPLAAIEWALASRASPNGLDAAVRRAMNLWASFAPSDANAFAAAVRSPARVASEAPPPRSQSF